MQPLEPDAVDPTANFLFCDQVVLTKPSEESAEEGEHQGQLQPCGPVPAQQDM